MTKQKEIKRGDKVNITIARSNNRSPIVFDHILNATVTVMTNSFARCFKKTESEFIDEWFALDSKAVSIRHVS